MGRRVSGVESYTYDEIDQAYGAALYLGRVHNTLATVLDVTRYIDDPGLFEYLNLLPTDLVLELLPSTAMLLAEAKARLAELESAVAAVMDYNAERVQAEAGAQDAPTEFERIMLVEFAKARKKNGGA